MKDIDIKNPKQMTEELLRRYFKVDGKKLTAQLYFDTFAELVDMSLGDNKVEKLNSTLFDKIDEILALVPRKYEIDFEVCIRDYGDYEPAEAERIVRENIALKVYALSLERRRKRITGLSLLGGGVVLLLASYFLSKLNLPQILFDVINISGTLLVWEAADVTIIERSEDAKRVKQYIRKFKEIHLKQA